MPGIVKNNTQGASSNAPAPLSNYLGDFSDLQEILALPKVPGNYADYKQEGQSDIQYYYDAGDDEWLPRPSDFKGYFDSLADLKAAFPNPLTTWRASQNSKRSQNYVVYLGEWIDEPLTLDGAYITTFVNEEISKKQNNFSKVINITSLDIIDAQEPTLDDQIASFVNSLNYPKLETDSEIWVDYKFISVEPFKLFLGINSIEDYFEGQITQVFLLSDAETNNFVLDDGFESVTFTVQVNGGAPTTTTLFPNQSFRIVGAFTNDDLLFSNVTVNLFGGTSSVSAPNFNFLSPPNSGETTSTELLATLPAPNSVYTQNVKYRIINVGKGILNINSNNLQVAKEDQDHFTRFLVVTTGDIANTAGETVDEQVLNFINQSIGFTKTAQESFYVALEIGAAQQAEEEPPAEPPAEPSGGR